MLYTEIQYTVKDEHKHASGLLRRLYDVHISDKIVTYQSMLVGSAVRAFHSFCICGLTARLSSLGNNAAVTQCPGSFITILDN
jgi:hypothetical protein